MQQFLDNLLITNKIPHFQQHAQSVFYAFYHVPSVFVKKNSSK